MVQLRQDNALGTLFNMVGFQTKPTYGEQMRIFRMIPGLERAEFARLGGVHRNTFINSPRLLDHQLRLKVMPHIRFAGQITGVEGYVESAAIGLLAGRFAAAESHWRADRRTAGDDRARRAARAHHRGADAATFQPMNVNFGLFPPLELPRQEGRAQAGAGAARAGRARRLAGAAGRSGSSVGDIMADSAVGERRSGRVLELGARHKPGSTVRRRSTSGSRR